ncbi:hypothetical protein J2S68_002781 [Glycomyces algeriensis]|nr:glycoside hydrolase family 95 protein [Glycomyces algeriensis]MDR7351238.1 hypothetical protein [Glycomyces algeriensis]
MAALRRRQVMKYGAASALAAPLQWAAPGTASAAARPAGDLSLWYDEQAGTDWLRALPVGNGRLGAMVFGNSGTERLQLNEDTVWAGGPHDYSNTAGANSLQQIRQLVFADQWGQAQDLINQTMLGKPAGQLAYQPVGDLNLAFPGIGGTSEYERWLDLTTAATGVSYLANGVRYQREVIATAPDQVIAVRLTAGTAGRISFTASFNTPQRATKSSPDSRTIALDGRSGDQRGIPGAVRFLALARAVAEGGSTSSSGGSLQVTNANAVTLLVSIGTSYVDYQNANGDYQGAAWNRLNAAGNRSYADLRARHAADYRELFDRTVIDLGRTAAADQTTDTRISQHGSGTDPQFSALLFQYGRYLLISSSRPGTQPANLQGIWNDSLTPSWESKYTLNANLPMNYWPADSTNLAECFEPVFDMIEDLTETGARTADVQYGAGGWVAHHNTDGWRGSSVVDDARWGMWPTGGAWLATMIWDHYRFTGDRGFLEANYPAMKGAAQFFLETLVEHPSLGWLVTNPSNSPEMLHHNDATVCAGPTMDNQILRDLFNGCASASEVLGIDADFRTQVRAARDRLAPMRVGSRGNIMEYLHDWIETDPAAPARLAPLRPAPEQPDHQARHPAAVHGRPPDPGAARRRGHRLVPRLEDQLLGAPGGGNAGARPDPPARDAGTARAQHVRPPSAVPDRRELRRDLGDRRDAAPEPQRRTAPAARAAGRLARRVRVRPARARRAHHRRHLERRHDRRPDRQARPHRRRQGPQPHVHRRLRACRRVERRGDRAARARGRRDRVRRPGRPHLPGDRARRRISGRARRELPPGGAAQREGRRCQRRVHRGRCDGDPVGDPQRRQPAVRLR